MGGVNLTEESRNILATNADFIGTQIRSCKDESFLFHNPLLSRITAIGEAGSKYELSRDARKPGFGISDLVRHKLGCTVSEDD